MYTGLGIQGGYANATAGHPDPTFIYHHQPFAYFADYADGTAGRSEHLKDERDMLEAINNRTLPSVSFYKPLGTNDEHPGYANIFREIVTPHGSSRSFLTALSGMTR